MPITITRDDELRRLTATVIGPLDTATFAEFTRTARAGDLRTYTLLFDARAATFEITADEVRTVILPIIHRLRAAEGDRAPAALLVANSVAARLARMFETLVDAQPDAGYYGVFRDAAMAEAWLTSAWDPRR